MAQSRNEALEWAAAVVVASAVLVIVGVVLNLEDLKSVSVAFLRVSVIAMTFLMMLNIAGILEKKLAKLQETTATSVAYSVAALFLTFAAYVIGIEELAGLYIMAFGLFAVITILMLIYNAINSKEGS